MHYTSIFHMFAGGSQFDASLMLTLSVANPNGTPRQNRAATGMDELLRQWGRKDELERGKVECEHRDCLMDRPPGSNAKVMRSGYRMQRVARLPGSVLFVKLDRFPATSIDGQKLKTDVTVPLTFPIHSDWISDPAALNDNTHEWQLAAVAMHTGVTPRNGHYTT